MLDDGRPPEHPGEVAEGVVKEAVGAACRMARARTGLGVVDFCIRAGVSRKHFNLVASGKGDPGVVWLRRIARAAGWNLEEIARVIESELPGTHGRG